MSPIEVNIQNYKKAVTGLFLCQGAWLWPFLCQLNLFGLNNNQKCEFCLLQNGSLAPYSQGNFHPWLTLPSIEVSWWRFSTPPPQKILLPRHKNNESVLCCITYISVDAPFNPAHGRRGCPTPRYYISVCYALLTKPNSLQRFYDKTLLEKFCVK